MPHDTLTDLKKPTFELIGSFYPMPNDVQEVFITMLGIYEQNPTLERAALLFDKVMSKEDPETKKQWFFEREFNLNMDDRKRLAEKYIQNRHAVPKGLPTSGNLLVGLGVVSRADKDLLMEAQAAARILGHIDNPYQVKLTQELFTTNESGQVTEARPYLDKPFSTPVQRMEHLCAIMAGYQVVQEPYQKVATRSPDLVCVPDISPTLEEFFKVAVDTLYHVAEKLSPQSAPVATEIQNLAESYLPRSEVKDWSFDTISKGMKEILPCLFMWHAPHTDKSKVNLCEDSYTLVERETVEKMIQKRIKQVQTGLALTHMSGKSYQK